MAGYYCTDIADLFRAGEIPPIEVDGWRTRSRASGGIGASGGFQGISIHHTASGPLSDGWPSVRYGTFDAAARPIANVYIDRSGRPWLAAAGATNTSGAGGPSRYIPLDGANSRTFGIEVQNNGVGEPYTGAQQMTLLRMVALLWNLWAPRHGWGNQFDRIYGHYEWTSRKCDPTGDSTWSRPPNTRGCQSASQWNMNQFRESVRAHAADLAHKWPYPLTIPQMRSCIAATKPTLRAFDTSFLVTYLQIVLAGKAGSSCNPSGVFDGCTDIAVRNLQAIRNLPIDGVVGPVTWPTVDWYGTELCNEYS